MPNSEVSSPIGWVFDPALPSGARSGGSAAKRAFTPDIGTLVREVLQNAKDAALGSKAAVTFKLIELSGDDVDRFLRSLEWGARLRMHVQAAAEEQKVKGNLLRDALDRLDEERQLTLLVVEDQLTSGLTGAEAVTSDEGSRFAALCRDELYSSKADETAGGSHGLGKAMLWQFSALSLVLFNSALAEPLGGRRNPRLIGRAVLPWHRIEGEGEFNGGGWFGYQRERQQGRWATSVWDEEAESLAEQLHLQRPAGSGTSIMVVGFREPAHEDRPLSKVAADIASAASEWFWPSLLGPAPSLEVSVEVHQNGERRERIAVTADACPEVQPYIAAFNDYREGNLAETLEHRGQTACVPVRIALPERRDGTEPAQEAEADLVVRLALPAEASVRPDAVGYFRGPGMIVRYRDLPRLSLTAQTFHALLVAGRARHQGDAEADTAADKFLRASEPPEHHQWTTTENLKSQYKQGYGQALAQLDATVRTAVRGLVTEQGDSGRRGPARLSKLFPIGTSGGGDTGYREFVSLSEVVAQLNENDGWSFSGKITAHGDVSEGWETSIEVHFDEEDGREARGANLICDLWVHEEDVPLEDVLMSSGGVEVIVPPRVPSIHFSGRTDPALKILDPRLSAIAITARGRSFAQ